MCSDSVSVKDTSPREDDIGRHTVPVSCGLHGIAPYVGKVKPSIARTLVASHVVPGFKVLDPFCGSGTFLLEAHRYGATVTGIDKNRYAAVLSRAKLNPPQTLREGLQRINQLEEVVSESPGIPADVPTWVRKFFHPKTLGEVLSLTSELRRKKDWFTLACLLGILHHQRPGFLSYPSSYFVPYLRNRKFPRRKYPELYAYRAVLPRLRSKVERVLSGTSLSPSNGEFRVIEGDFLETELEQEEFDVVLTSPPYMGNLTYGRDNRLRLYFLGESDPDWLDRDEPSNPRFFTRFLRDAFMRVDGLLSKHGRVLMVLGTSRRRLRPLGLKNLAVEACRSSAANLRLSRTEKYEWVPKGNDCGKKLKRVTWYLLFERAWR